MFVLNDQQVSFILNDIRRNGIELEELQLNLLDHICCVIENEMPPEKSFEEFYRSILPRFFRHELREIQEETDLLLTFKHYYAMKKVMIISGTISATAFVLGSFFKVMHWPGASMLLVLGITIISFVFLPLLFVLKAKEVNATRNKMIVGLGSFFGMIMSLAILFKVMHWPGATIMWLTALGILFFLFLPIYFFTGVRNPDTKVNTMVSSILILVAGAMMFMLINLRPSHSIEYANFSANQHISQVYKYATEQNNQKYLNLISDSSNVKSNSELLKTSSNDLCNKVELIKSQIVAFVTDGNNPESEEELMRDLTGNYDAPTNVLFEKNSDPKAALKELKSAIGDFKILLKESFSKNDTILLNTNDVHKFGDPYDVVISWEKANYYQVPFENVMRNLTQLQLDIRIIEASCLK